VGGAIAGQHAVAEAVVPLVALHEVMGQLGVVLGQAVRVQILDGAAHGAVQLLAPLHEQAAVGDVLDDGVLEDVRRVG
jgi:hypothetical protein